MRAGRASAPDQAPRYAPDSDSDYQPPGSRGAGSGSPRRALRAPRSCSRAVMRPTSPQVPTC